MSNFFLLSFINGNATTDDTLNGNYEVVSFNCNNSFYNIVEGYNTFILAPEIGPPLEIEIPAGYYDPYSLKDQLGLLLPLTTVDYDPVTHKYTFTGASSFGFIFSSEKLSKST